MRYQNGRLSRRGWLKHGVCGVAGGSLSGWLSQLAAAEPRPPRSVILLWMNGGPATIDLWDLKPGHDNGGPVREIATATPGIRISEHLPALARWTDEMAIVRSMQTPEGDHDRATHLLRTGYQPQGAIRFPAVGAAVAQRLAGRRGSDVPERLPRFVSVAPTRYAATLGAGYLGPNWAPFQIGRAGGTLGEMRVADLDPPAEIDRKRMNRRWELLRDFEAMSPDGRSDVIASLQNAAGSAERLMDHGASAVFDLEQESDRARDRYGRTLFGQGCLLARRLVERGVSFVEVTLDGWDTHRDNFQRVADLSQTLDTAMPALLFDLKQRGLLESTLVVWQGEFGRTPIINSNTGRDHWPHAWSVVLAGGGIRGGQVIGKTSPDGREVTDRPASVPDLVATVCQAAGIDPRLQNLSNVNRPIRIADPTGTPIAGVTG